MDPDGFSSSLDLMKTVGASCLGEEPSGYPSGDLEETLSSEGSEDAETLGQPLEYPYQQTRELV